MDIRDPNVFLDYLGRVHERTRRIVLLIPPADIEWTATPGKFTLGDTVRHLACIERDVYAEAAAGRPNRYRGHGTDLARGYHATLVFYDTQHTESLAIFLALTADDMQAKTTTPMGTPMTLWKWLRAMLEHEMHHRGQLYLMLGVRGMSTTWTQTRSVSRNRVAVPRPS